MQIFVGAVFTPELTRLDSTATPLHPTSLPSSNYPAMADSPRAARRKGLSQSLNHEVGLWEASQRFWRKSYAGDYLGLIFLVVAFILLKTMSEPWHRMFRLDDPRLQHPHAEVERVTVRRST